MNPRVNYIMDPATSAQIQAILLSSTVENPFDGRFDNDETRRRLVDDDELPNSEDFPGIGPLRIRLQLVQEIYRVFKEDLVNLLDEVAKSNCYLDKEAELRAIPDWDAVGLLAFTKGRREGAQDEFGYGVPRFSKKLQDFVDGHRGQRMHPRWKQCEAVYPRATGRANVFAQSVMQFYTQNVLGSLEMVAFLHRIKNEEDDVSTIEEANNMRIPMERFRDYLCSAVTEIVTLAEGDRSV